MIILDTHIWLWLVNGDFDNIPEHWLVDIESANRVGVCSLSCYEIALAHSRGRIKLPSTAQNWFESAFEPVGIELIPLTYQIASRAVSLSPIHKDPFDRLIIATTLAYKGCCKRSCNEVP
ncbi:MAG: type II toxin-antitoxin system VapC family toxin [Cyanobacteria bacterium J06627_28]